MDDPNVVVVAPNISAMLGSVVGSEEGLQDRGRGVILGLAVGNLLGLPMEGWPYREIDHWYPEGIVDIDAGEAFMPMDDDLAQAVDLGEALLGGGDCVGEFGRRLVAWRRENGRGIGVTTDRVIGVLEAGHQPPDAARIAYEVNPIAPNGGVMRCAPVALARFGESERLVSDSAATCVVTHYAPTSQWSCIIINAVIALLLKGTEPDLTALMGAASEDRCPDMLGTALRDGIPSDVLASIVSGEPVSADCSWLRRDQRLIGHTLIALQAGLWSAVTSLGFEEALRQVVEAGGDTDTNGAVAGAVLGARYGASAIPRRWLDVIPQRDWIESVADGLLELAAG